MLSQPLVSKPLDLLLSLLRHQRHRSIINHMIRDPVSDDLPRL